MILDWLIDKLDEWLWRRMYPTPKTSYKACWWYISPTTTETNSRIKVMWK